MKVFRGDLILASTAQKTLLELTQLKILSLLQLQTFREKIVQVDLTEDVTFEVSRMMTRFWLGCLNFLGQSRADFRRL